MSSCNNRFKDSDTYIHNGLKVDENWKLITGIVFETYPNDSLKSEIEYLKGKMNGVYKQFYENGQLKKEGNLVNGQREGSYKGFIDDGRLIIEGYYKNDLKDSIWNKYCFNFSENNLKTQLEDKYVYKDSVKEFIYYNEGLKGIGTNYNISGNYYFNRLLGHSSDSIKIDYKIDSITNKKWEILFKKYYNTRNIGKPVDSLSGLSILPEEGKFNLNEFFSYKFKYNGYRISTPFSGFDSLEFYNISKVYSSKFDFREIFPLKLLDLRNESLKYFSQDGTLLFSRKLSEDIIYLNTDYIPNSEEISLIAYRITKPRAKELHFLEYSSQDGTPLFLRDFSDIIVENSKYSVSIDEYGSGVVYGKDDCSFCSDLGLGYIINSNCDKASYYLDIIEELEEL